MTAAGGLRVGLIGCGKWGRHILRDLVALGAETTVVAPHEATRARAIAGGAIEAVAELDKLIGRVQGFVVATPTSTHGEILERLLPTGVPIFVEKPLSNDAPSARRIAAAGNGRVFVMDKWRYHPGVCALGELARSGALGRILAIRSVRLGWGNPHEVDAVWILAPHDLAIALHILGDLPPVRWARAPGGVPPGSAVIAELSRPNEGATVTLEVSAIEPERRRSVVVVGERVSVQLADAYDDHLILMNGPPLDVAAARRLVPFTTAMPLYVELKAFLDHLGGGPPPRSSVAEGALVVERISEIRRLCEFPS
jgi:predicted dehydrogenase